MIKAGIIGGAGYTGLELVRLLLMHPEVEISVVTSRRYKGKKISDVNPHLEPFIELEYEDVDTKEIADRADIVFLAVPHGSAMDYVPQLRAREARVIDLSADYRLKKEEYERIYKRQHKDKDKEKRKSVYGLTELHPEVADADLIANPGCYPTGAILAVAPLMKGNEGGGRVKQVVFDSKSGISGGGAEPSDKSHFPNLAENIVPYEVTAHRHVAEMRMELSVKVSFTPHVIPSIRGILTTAHVFIEESGAKTQDEIEETYKRFYEGKRFMRLRKGLPSLSSVRGTNFCDIGFKIEEKSDRIVVISAIDNLVKGGSGQAIQNMNLMFGLDEREGLWFPGLVP
uniref:N-acetyl-gamma-glutamyl-phosphate reductase n=1 Tax=Candidatus Methanophagaceae archaeon ANME-1 ERB6 TaxID=2759912 RepID=A0A7G9Z198_9EURY|nr:[LysW]-L-2-aminoadipate/[LysW]-L-glutamate phosphate reductase [Methanosarcinales archaeon ANME-1 ERB6]